VRCARTSTRVRLVKVRLVKVRLVSVVPSCPACYGDGGHDFKDDNALMREHFTDEQIAHWVDRGMLNMEPWVECSECEGTGVVSEERLLDIQAYARAAVDQTIARYNHEKMKKRG